MCQIKKIVFLSSVFLVTNLSAEIEYFIGLRTNMANITLEVPTTTSSNIGNENKVAYSINNGIIIDERIKLTVGYSQYALSGNSSMNSVDLGYSYYLDNINFTFQKKEWKPFANIDYMRSAFKWKDTNINTDMIMLGFGTDYHINERLFLMAGYGFTIFSASNETENGKIERINRAYLDINYKF